MRLFLAAILLLQLTARPQHRPIPSLPTQRFIDDMRTKNIEDILALYTPDAVFVQPDGTAIATPQALRRLYEQVFATYDSDLTLARGGLGIEGDPSTPGAIASQSGEYSEDLRTRATNTTAKLCGRYSFTWVLQKDGRWLLSRMRWTSNPCSSYHL